MASASKQKDSSKKTVRRDIAAEVANTFEWLITAFVLAFLFRAFVMEAFRIPTGSMADTLKGAHFRLRCPQCGCRYDYGFVPERFGLPSDYIPYGGLRGAYDSRCPSCGYYRPTGGTMPISNGDRILVLKCIYQFFEPRQWDVVVFKNPLDPRINYIKRLIGRPGEEVEIIDGDIYINGQICRKPPKAQDELWMPVYDNDYQPVRADEPRFNGHPWEQPFRNIKGSKWRPDTADHTKFLLESPADKVNTMVYDSSAGNDFRATYAYDEVKDYPYLPFCSDLMVRFYVSRSGGQGQIGIGLSKYGIFYRASMDSAGEMVISRLIDGQESILARDLAEPTADGKATLVKFANVDHRLVFRVGDKEVIYDMGRRPDDAGVRRVDTKPQAEIFGSGNLTLSHLAVFRDIHYTATKYAASTERGRATEGSPLKLEKDEFFVLGDNSPNSEDGRWWGVSGKGNNGTSYRAGIVPRDYLVGKALFVYWPSGFRPYPTFPFGIIPNVGQMRFIHGGKDGKP